MFRNLSFRYKLLSVCAILSLFVISITAIVNYLVTYRGLTENLLSFSDDYLIEFNRNIDSRVNELKFDIHTRLERAELLNRKNFDSFMDSIKTDDNVEAREVYRLSASILAANPYFRSILIVDDKGRSHYHVQSSIHSRKEDMISIFAETEVRTTVLRRMDQNSLVYMKPVIDRFTTEFLGTIVIEMDQRFFLNPISRTNDRNNWTILLLDEENRLLSCEKDIISHFEFLDRSYDFSGIMTRSYKYEKNAYILNSVPSERGYFRVVNIISREEIRRSSSILLRAILLTSVIALVIALFSAMLFSNGLSRSVNILIDKIKAVSRGEFHNPIEISSNDEFAMIASEVNHMSSEIDSLINKVYKEQISKEKAQREAVEFEYSALVSKMNPHFLYNTLEGINSMAKLKGHQEISEATCALAELLRDTVRDERPIVYLEDELDYVEKYIRLKQMMRKDGFTVKFDMDEMLLGAKIPRFILQPVVENAFKYGIEKMEGGELLIKCFLEDKNLKLMVLNSSPDEYPEVRKGVEEAFWQGSHIGLSNIEKRLKLLFGEESGICYKREGRLFSVMITMPYKTH